MAHFVTSICPGFVEKENIPGGWNLSCGQVFNLEHLISCSRYKNIAGIFGGSVTKWRDNCYRICFLVHEFKK